MTTRLYSRIAMLGAAPETRGSIAAVVDAYRAQGLMKRWPISYLATHGEGTLARKASLAAHAVRDFAALLARQRHIVVHVHLSGGAFWREAPFMAAARVAGCPILLHLHGAGFDPRIAWFIERAAVIAVPCESMRTWVKSVVRSADVVVVPPPVAISVSQVPVKPNLVVFLGHLEADKGIFDLLDALAGVRASVPDVRLACAGDGDRIGVARYADMLGLADAVKFTGYVGPSGKRALLENAAVLALPSYEESLPVSLAEAMSAGVPVVASSVGGIPEVVVDRVSGLLVPPGDKSSLERALTRILAEPGLAARLGGAARETARARFAPERSLALLEDIYESLGVDALSERTPRFNIPLRKAA